MNFHKKSKPHCIIYNGVDTSTFIPNDLPLRKFGFPAVIISASKYRLHKRLQDAINLINFLSKDFPNIKLNVLGELDVLTKECVKNIDKSRCVFHGKINPNDLPYYYQNSHVQLHLSIFDPCPNVVVEGLSCGLPVITPFESGAKELIGPQNRNWAVNEGLKLNYKELHLSNKIPQINLQKYETVFKNVFLNLDKNKLSARKRALTTLDINLVLIKYESFLKKFVNIKKVND